MHREDFPLLVNYPDIVYLDNAATTQKPAYVIDGVADFLRNEYSNIHRGLYPLSEQSECHFYNSKKLVWELVNVWYKQVVYTSNATDSVNILVQSLVNSNKLKPWDTVLLGIWDHHANLLPWLSYAKHFGYKVKYFYLKEDYTIDYEDFQKQYSDDVKVVACWEVSNVTWAICDVKKIKSLLRDDTFFVVDGSQAVPNMPVDFQDIWCDALVFTGHKMMAYTWIGVLVLKEEWVKELTPINIGWGTVKDVSRDSYLLKWNVWKFEAWTPDIIWAVSLEKALEYIKTLWEDWSLLGGMEVIWEHEKKLMEYIRSKFAKLGGQVTVYWPQEAEKVALFSFVVNWNTNFNQVWEFFADKNVCIRCWGHCAYPLHKYLNIWGTCRMSAYLYNDEKDVDYFFEVMDELLKSS